MHLIPKRYLSFKPEECFKLTTVHNIQQKRVVLQQQNTWLSLDISTNQVVHIWCCHEPHRRMSGLQKPSIAWKLDAFHTLKIISQQAVSTNLWIWWFMKPMVWCVNTVPPGEWKLHSTVIIAGDMIDDWLDDRIIEPRGTRSGCRGYKPASSWIRLAQRTWDLSRTRSSHSHQCHERPMHCTACGLM